MNRDPFDKLLTEMSELGCENWRDLTPQNRKRLVRLYFASYHEWADAFFDEMGPILALFENDEAGFGQAMAQRMTAYVKPYVERQLEYKALCRRERDEMGDIFKEGNRA